MNLCVWCGCQTVKPLETVSVKSEWACPECEGTSWNWPGKKDRVYYRFSVRGRKMVDVTCPAGCLFVAASEVL